MASWLEDDWKDPVSMAAVARNGFPNERELLVYLMARQLIDDVMSHSKYRDLWHAHSHHIIVGNPDHAGRAAARREQPSLPFGPRELRRG